MHASGERRDVTEHPGTLDQTGAPPRAPRRIGWVVFGLFVVAIGVAAWIKRSGSTNGAASPATAGSASTEVRAVPVVVAQVEKRDVPVYLEALGNAVPLATVTVRSQVDGRLDKVLFREGQSVKKGDVLAQIDPRPFVIALHQAQATLARDSAQARNAKRDLERYQNLVGQKLIPQQQLDGQQTTYDQAVAAMSGDQAQIESARLQLDYASIKSPGDGVTGVRLVDPGNIIHAADTGGIVVVTQLDPMAVIFTLPQDDLPRVSKELAGGPLSVEAYTRDGGTRIGTGKLELIDNQVNQATATIRLKAIFPNSDKTLWPNAFLKIRLLLATKNGALVIPATAVQRGPQGTFVYLVDADKKANMKPIDVDSTLDEWAVIAHGLAPGDQVVTEGQNQLRPGAKVMPRPAVTAGKDGAHGAPAGTPHATTPGASP